ncbi:unnamed protein product [Dracunculus medinensis]|uniref:C2H2-type domain-containing protein n=1 Tax=Dracunculus medinensis TaxID=318479 RepID=A0A3P7P8Z0_DRAME|nr:unnamed protein product [Dracunculus medinensis]
MNLTTIPPHCWLMETLERVQFVLVIFSEGTRIVLQGESLNSPFSHLFVATINYIMLVSFSCGVLVTREIDSSYMAKFIFLRMSYSSSTVIPDWVHAVSARILELPLKIYELLALLSNEEQIEVEKIGNNEMQKFLHAVKKVTEYHQNNPFWLRKQVVKYNDKSGDYVMKVEDLAHDVGLCLQSDRKQKSVQTCTMKYSDKLSASAIPLFENRLLLVKDQSRIAQENNLEYPDSDSISESDCEETCFALIKSLNDDVANECVHCGAKFDRFNQLRTHIAFTHRVKHQCHICAYSSNVKAELKKHIIINHEKGVRCTVAGCSTTISYFRLKRHIEKVHSMGNRNTKINNSLIRKNSFKSEKLSAASQINSPKQYLFSADLDKEVMLHDEPNNEYLPNSPILNLNNAINSNVNSENQSHKSYFAPNGLDSIAGKNFRATDDLENHLCNICNKQFTRMLSLIRHYKRIHLQMYKRCTVQKELLCEIAECNRQFSSQAKLHDHILSHIDQPIVACNNCNKKFKSRAHFAVHLRHYHQASIRDLGCNMRNFNILSNGFYLKSDYTSINVKLCGIKLPHKSPEISTENSLFNS